MKITNSGYTTDGGCLMLTFFNSNFTYDEKRPKQREPPSGKILVR